MDEFGPDAYGEHFADVYDDWYGDVTDAAATAAFVADLAGGRGRVVELGVGTGRIALPLADQGLEVIGIDASPSMLAALHAKPGGERIVVHQADLAALDDVAVADVDVALLTFNTLFNLHTEADQLACLRSAARWLRPEGRLVVEAWVPADDLADQGPTVSPTRIAVDEVVLTASTVDPETLVVTGQHIHLRETGIRLRPWRLRMLSVAALDALADDAGLVLAARHADWRRTPFDEDSTTHVSIYRLADADPAAR